MAHFELFQDQGKPRKWRFRVRADNGEIVASSEAYDSEENAKRATVDLVGVVLKAKNAAILKAGSA